MREAFRPTATSARCGTPGAVSTSPIPTTVSGRAPLQLRGLGQLLQGSAAPGAARRRLRDRGRLRGRPLEPEGAPRRSESRPARADARTRRRTPARRVERDPLVLRRRDAVRARRALRARADAPVDVLRAVQPRAVHRGRAVPADVLRGARAVRAPARAFARRRLRGAGRDGAAPRRAAVPRRRAVLDRGHLALRVHARRARGGARSRAVSGDPRLARPSRLAAGARHDRRVSVRVRFAPSPTGSLHLGNALTAVANRRFADESGGTLVLRIDDTDPSRSVEGGEEAILAEVEWLGVGFDEGPVRQSERGALYSSAAEGALAAGAATRDDEGAVRLGRDGVTLLRDDGTATYQLASVVDDLELDITHVIRGSDHRPNLELQRRIARAVGSELPGVIHHGLVLGPDGKKLSKRHGHASVAELREEGFPAGAVRAYLDELGFPEHDVHLDLTRLRRLAIDAIAAMPDEELAAAAGAPIEVVPALRGARSLVEAAEYARLVATPPSVEVPVDARLSLDRFEELRAGGSERVSLDEARAIVRELKAVGADLRSLRLALTGAPKGPELAAVLAALSREEALARAARATATEEP